MKCFCLILTVFALAMAADASWYWPFGSDGDDSDAPRLSELMEPATELIDEASDLAADGKVQDAVEKYRKALEELDRIELENPDRAKNAEFATIRNKRAYVNAAIDSMLLRQVKENARSVAVSDTAALEKRLAEERAAKSGKKPERKPEVKPEGEVAEKPVGKSRPEKPAARESAKQEPVVVEEADVPRTPKERVIRALSKRDYAEASRTLEAMLVEKPNDPTAMNLRAAMEMSQGEYKKAEATLDQVIMSNPRNHYAYYNMALLMLQVGPDGKSVARRYYETGRAVGGPKDVELEERLK